MDLKDQNICLNLTANEEEMLSLFEKIPDNKKEEVIEKFYSIAINANEAKT